jgi:DNA-binding MarR family transcriptional regulator
MTRYQNLSLDRQLCFALYAATHGITRSYRVRLKAVGLTYPQYLVMLALWEEDGRAVSQLAQRLHLDSAAITPLLKRLEGAGFLERQRRSSEERVVQSFLTPAGRELEHEVARIQGEVACQAGLPEDVFMALCSTLHELTQRMADDPEVKRVAA